MIVGLQRPPIGSESHSHHGLTAIQGEPQALISAGPDGDQQVVVTIATQERHDAAQADRPALSCRSFACRVPFAPDASRSSASAVAVDGDDRL